jgi:putative beta-barrel porin BBP2
MQGSRSHAHSAPAQEIETRVLLSTNQNVVPQRKGYSSMRKNVFLIGSLVICGTQFLHAQSFQNPISINPDAGGFQANPPLITPGGGNGPNVPIGPVPEYNPEGQPAPANELVPSYGGKKNVIEEATQKLWRLIFTIQGGVYWDSNIFLSQNHPVGDTVIQLAGGFSFEIGDYRSQTNNFLTLKYLATGYIYTGRPEENGVDQQVVFHGQYRWDRLTLQSNVAFSYLDGPDRLAGTFTTQYLVDGLVRALYDYSDKTQLHAEFEQITDIYPSQLSSYEYIGRVGADYLITPKIKIGVEGDVGDLQIEHSGDMFYGEGRLRVAYQLTQKLTFLASGGFEVAHFSQNDDTKVLPVFDLSAQWTPFVGTTFGLSAFRKIFASPVEVGNVFTATGVQATVSQTFFQRLSAAVFVGYENDQYKAAGSNAVATSRADNYVYVRPNLTYSIGGWCNIVLYYQFNHNDSNLNGASFTDHRIGGQVIFAF